MITIIAMWFTHVQDDMYAATISMGNLLRQSVTTGKAAKWRTDESSFHQGTDEQLTHGCINLSPCWFQQGHEVCVHQYTGGIL